MCVRVLCATAQYVLTPKKNTEFCYRQVYILTPKIRGEENKDNVLTILHFGVDDDAFFLKIVC